MSEEVLTTNPEETVVAPKDYDHEIFLEGDDTAYQINEVPETELRVLKNTFTDQMRSQKKMAYENSKIQNAILRVDKVLDTVATDADADPADADKAYAEYEVLAEQEKALTEQVEAAEEKLKTSINETLNVYLVRRKRAGVEIDKNEPLKTGTRVPLFQAILSASSLGGDKQDSSLPRSRR